MSEFDETERPPIFNIPEEKNSLIKLPQKPKGIFRSPEIDPALRLKWGLALLGEEKAKEYLAWIQAKFGTDSQ